MRWKTTVVLLLATIGLGAYVSMYELKQPTTEERERQSQVLMRVKPAEVTQVALAMPQGTITLTRQDKLWRLGPGDYRADPDQVERLLAQLQTLRAERILTPRPGQPLDLKAYGLDPGIGRLTLTTASGTQTLLLGEPTPVGGNRYTKTAEAPSAGIISGQLFDQVNHPLDDFRDPRLLRADTWDIDGVSFTDAQGALHVQRDEHGWQLTAPMTDRAEDAEVSAWLNKVLFLRIQKFLPPLPAGAVDPAGFDHPKTTVTLHRKGEVAPLTLAIGQALAEDQKLRYAQRSDEPYRYAVAAADVEGLSRDPHGLRSTALFERVFPSQVVKVELMQDGKTRTLEQKDGAWTQVGSATPPDKAQVEGWLRQVAEAHFSGFVAESPKEKELARYGLSEPSSRLSIWLSGAAEPQVFAVGKTIEGTTNRYAQSVGRATVVRVPEDVVKLLAPAGLQ